MSIPQPRLQPNEDVLATKILRRVSFVICPTGPYCREDRCQSFFRFELIPSVRAPLEECEAAGAIKSVGGEATIIDAQTEKLGRGSLIERIVELQPDAIVLVVTFGTLNEDLAWAKVFKSELPNVAIGVRGAPCYTSEKEIFESSSEIDFSVKGEYETIFAHLASKGIAGCQGVSYRQGGEVFYSPPGQLVRDLDQLPLPDRSSIKSHLYRVRGFGALQATVRVQRGCPYPCSYCLVHTVNGKVVRHRSPKHIVSEVAILVGQGIRHFYFRADTFTIDKKWALELCEELTQSCPGIRWVTTTRVDRVDNELIQAMARAGCYGISFGVDVASKTIGEKVHKYADAGMTKAALQACHDAGILSLAYIMIGFIWETRQTLSEVSSFLRQINPDLLTIHFAHPYPGTQYYESFRQTGVSLTSHRAQAEPAMHSEGLSVAQLKAFARLQLARHYTRPSIVLSILKKVARGWLRRTIRPR